MIFQRINKALLANLAMYLLSVALALTVVIRFLNFENLASLERDNIGIKVLFLGSVSSFLFVLLYAHAKLIVKLMKSLPVYTNSPPDNIEPHAFSGWRALGIGWMTFFLVQAITQPLYLVTKVPMPGGLNPTEVGFYFTLFNYGFLTPLLETLLQCAFVLAMIKFLKDTKVVALVVGMLAALAHGYTVSYWWIASLVVFFCTTIIFLSQARRRRGVFLAFLAHAAHNTFGLALLVGLWYIDQ